VSVDHVVSKVAANGPVCWIVPRNLQVRAPEGFQAVGPPIHLTGIGHYRPLVEFSSESFRNDRDQISACLLISSVLVRVVKLARLDPNSIKTARPRLPLVIAAEAGLLVRLEPMQRWTGEVFAWPMRSGYSSPG
jgi:hypothetical protein